MTMIVSLVLVLCLINISAFTRSTKGLRVGRLHDMKTFSAKDVHPTSTNIAFTREEGSNKYTMDMFLNHNINCYELPCIEFSTFEQHTDFATYLLSHNVTIITSPQSAKVFSDMWQNVGNPFIKIVSVGAGTSKTLISRGITPVFVPSQATADSLAAELPLSIGRNVFYPASFLADNRLVMGLESRGFKVTRLNTYTTKPTLWTPDNTKLAKEMDIVTFASPSAVHNWADNVGTSLPAVAIGPTTAAAARKLGFCDVYSPKVGSKGVKPWVELIKEIAIAQNACKRM